MKGLSPERYWNQTPAVHLLTHSTDVQSTLAAARNLPSRSNAEEEFAVPRTHLPLAHPRAFAEAVLPPKSPRPASFLFFCLSLLSLLSENPPLCFVLHPSLPSAGLFLTGIYFKCT